ncbi:glycosyltransferase family A protein [Halostella litorea]|uniref:glycosyltransferase family A protein n=1 Tax=Halostella litorea TaxID=2528831 RepID=UPI001091A070|nr:glycosyltransferase family A protein [Halostella litorea]
MGETHDVDAIEVALPTADSASTLDGTLARLRESVAAADVAVARLLLVDDESDDDTRAIARRHGDEAGWPVEVRSLPCSLPRARELAIDAVGTDWFLFLDDDVRVSESYVGDLLDATAPSVGGVQGRKATRTESPSDWVRRRSRRAGTHATLLRRAAVRDVSFPPDLHVLEDEYLRRHVETRGYLWVFNHRARFEHANQGRHPIGWQEGYLGAKYGLSRFHDVALNVPFAAATGRNPLPYAKRAAGWVAGRVARSAGGETGVDPANA